MMGKAKNSIQLQLMICLITYSATAIAFGGSQSDSVTKVVAAIATIGAATIVGMEYKRLKCQSITLFPAMITLWFLSTMLGRSLYSGSSITGYFVTGVILMLIVCMIIGYIKSDQTEANGAVEREE